MTEIRTADSVCLSLLVFSRNYFRKFHCASQPNRRKNRIYRKIPSQGHSRSYMLGSLERRWGTK